MRKLGRAGVAGSQPSPDAMSTLLEEYASRCAFLGIAHHPVLVAQLDVALQPGISFVNAAGGGLTHRDLDALLHSLLQVERSGRQVLFHVDLSDSWGEASHTACVGTLVAYLRQMRSVTHLVMRGCRLTDADGEAIVGASCVPSLARLDQVEAAPRTPAAALQPRSRRPAASTRST